MPAFGDVTSNQALPVEVQVTQDNNGGFLANIVFLTLEGNNTLLIGTDEIIANLGELEKQLYHYYGYSPPYDTTVHSEGQERFNSGT